MICALIQHKYGLAGKMMEQDGFHEPFRQHLIPEFEEVRHYRENTKHTQLSSVVQVLQF